MFLVRKTNLSRYAWAFCNTLQTLRLNRPNYLLELLYFSVLTVRGLKSMSFLFSVWPFQNRPGLSCPQGQLILPSESALLLSFSGSKSS